MPKRVCVWLNLYTADMSRVCVCVWTCPLRAFLDYLDVNVHEVSFVCSVTIKCCGDVRPIVNHR